MSDEDVPVLSPELEKLLEDERHVPDVSPEVRRQVRDGVERSTESGGGGGGGGGGGASFGSGGIRTLATHVLALLTGGVAGVALYTALSSGAHSEATHLPAQERATDVAIEEVGPLEREDMPESASAASGVAGTSATGAPAASGVAGTNATGAPARGGSERTLGAGGAGSTLAREQRILDAARGALSRGRADTALAATERHAGLFADGQLAEEREAIAVRALAALGLADEARARAARFHETYPGSFLAGSVNAALESWAAAVPDQGPSM